VRLGIDTRSDRNDGGFTLVELLIVVLIIAVLIAIGIPTFLGARKRAQDRAAQSSLRLAATAAKLVYTNTEDYTRATTSELGSSETSLAFVAHGTPSTGPTEVSVQSTSPTRFYAAALSKDGKCWLLRDVASAQGSDGGTMWSLGTTTSCTADDAVAAEATFVRDLASL